MSTIPDQHRIRRKKLEDLKAAGADPFVWERYPRTHRTATIVDRPDHHMDTVVSVGGRITAIRMMGRAGFLDVSDETGSIQVYLRKDEVGDEVYAAVRTFDLSDIIGVTGPVIRTDSGETSIRAKECVLLAKALRPLPLGKEYEGKRTRTLTNPDLRQRLRYVDFAVHPEARDYLVRRAAMVRAIREFLDNRGYTEVETPVLQAIAGGAAARPFTTHHHALDADLKLRISLELPLKRLIVGGFPKVYELGRVFRNEGADRRHNPEFTLLELYEAFSNLEDIMDLVEAMYVVACTAVTGSTSFWANIRDDRIEIDVAKRPWRRLPMLDGLREYGSIGPDDLRDLDRARDTCRRFDIDPEAETSVGGMIEKLHERIVQPKLIEPTFITDFPVETSPLAKKKPGNPELTRRFEVYMATQELGNAFSEINDPIDQRARFEDQVSLRDRGDAEAHPMDEDFLTALEYGMPPTGGLGVGIDRLAMVLTGASDISDVITFPAVRQLGR